MKMKVESYFPIFGDAHPSDSWIAIDLSEGNPELDFNKTSDSNYLEAFIQSQLSAQNTVAIGGYREKRATYRAAPHFSNQEPEKARDLHLGIDLWVEAGTKIYAPLDGVVHSFQCNDLPFDYGPTIILEHQDAGKVFYSLYGHLSLDSLDGLVEGMKIQQGDVFAYVGNRDVNGGWPPHLHLQVMFDMYGLKGDFFGATSEEDKQKFFSNCPDPSFLLGL